MEQTVTFEEAMNKLKELSDKIKAEGTSLEDQIRCYEEGMTYYKILDQILKEAKQKIETVEVL